jgi:hypothetical protein
MEKLNTHIWYASYGSNISSDRFMCYIQGGKPEGATRTYKGCTDKTPPIAEKPIQIPHELYFAKEAGVWNGGGVCFINPVENELNETLGKMYLISHQQFIELVQQENNASKPLEIDFEKAQNQKSLIIKKDGWYGNLLHLGEEWDAPIFTFTIENYLLSEINAPNLHYLKTIVKGLLATHRLSPSELEAYFLPKKGIDKAIIDEVVNRL